MKNVDIYKQYFSAECTFGEIQRFTNRELRNKEKKYVDTFSFQGYNIINTCKTTTKSILQEVQYARTGINSISRR